MTKDEELPGGELVLGRYRLDDGPPLGTGGWCVVRRATDTRTGRGVAVKTYTAQAARELGEASLLERFAREVSTFEALGVGPGTEQQGEFCPHQVFVRLLDHSRSEDTRAAGSAADGSFYTVLELADETLADWLEREAGVNIDSLCAVISGIAAGLAWLHHQGFCHLDVKPENVMRFGGTWKLIDLEGCLRMSTGVVVSQDNFTPLYASPELARFALGESTSIEPAGTMDTWAAGVLLLDLLEGQSAFQETKSGFDFAALFEEESLPNESWYRWLSDSAPLVLDDYVTRVEGRQTLQNSHAIRGLLSALLERDPAQRLCANAFLECAVSLNEVSRSLLAAPAKSNLCAERAPVEAEFRRLGIFDGSLARDVLRRLVVQLGLSDGDACLFLNSLDPAQKTHIHCTEFLDFLYGPE